MQIAVWVFMVICQEWKMSKYKAIFKFFVKPSYHKDIMFLARNLSRCKYRGEKGYMLLGSISFSHEINYPNWVDKLERDYRKNGGGVFPPIKVLAIDEKYYVIDGNHRLKALKRVWGDKTPITVIELKESK